MSKENQVTTSSNLYGYFSGGTFSPPFSYISTISRLNFSNETVSNIVSTLPSGKTYLSAVTNSN